MNEDTLKAWDRHLERVQLAIEADQRDKGDDYRENDGQQLDTLNDQLPDKSGSPAALASFSDSDPKTINRNKPLGLKKLQHFRLIIRVTRQIQYIITNSIGFIKKLQGHIINCIMIIFRTQ